MNDEKTFIVRVTTTFVKEYEVDASSAEEAKEIVGEDLDDAIDTEPDTEIEVVYER